MYRRMKDMCGDLCRDISIFICVDPEVLIRCPSPMDQDLPKDNFLCKTCSVGKYPKQCDIYNHQRKADKIFVVFNPFKYFLHLGAPFKG